MKSHHLLCWAALTGVSDGRPRSVEEIHELQRRAWSENGLMVVSCDDPRLGDEDRCDLYRIAARLSGDRQRRHRGSAR